LVNSSAPSATGAAQAGSALITSAAITTANKANLANPNPRNSFCSTLAILLLMIPVCR
jgi:hypothetical protein